MIDHRLILIRTLEELIAGLRAMLNEAEKQNKQLVAQIEQQDIEIRRLKGYDCYRCEGSGIIREHLARGVVAEYVCPVCEGSGKAVGVPL